VGGGRFFSENIKIIIIKLVNKRFIFLKNNLFILNLGYIFISTKKLIKNKLIEEFDQYRIQFFYYYIYILIIEVIVKKKFYIINDISPKTNKYRFGKYYIIPINIP
jgi:hypothetical protein